MRWISVLALAMLSFAGCLDDQPEEAREPPAEPGGLDRLPWAFTSCDAVIAIFPVAANAVAPHLPDNFSVAAFKDVLGVPLPLDPPGADGNFGVELLVCDDGTYGSYFAGVVAPEVLQRDVDLHFVKWDVGFSDANLTETLTAAGVPARNISGDYTLSTGVEPVGLALFGSMALDGAGHFLDAVGALPNNDYPTGRFVEYTETDDGLVEWQMSFTWLRSGLGVVDLVVDPGTLAADVLGTNLVIGAGFVGEIDMHDGFIQFPAGPSADPATLPGGWMA